ncbi:MAG: hypothetical protein NDJ89_04255 [Oligoflexia bacterium]|nr:hypothetical protein [Oligoflexia bacterium]
MGASAVRGWVGFSLALAALSAYADALPEFRLPERKIVSGFRVEAGYFDLKGQGIAPGEISFTYDVEENKLHAGGIFQFRTDPKDPSDASLIRKDGREMSGGEKILFFRQEKGTASPVVEVPYDWKKILPSLQSKLSVPKDNPEIGIVSLRPGVAFDLDGDRRADLLYLKVSTGANEYPALLAIGRNGELYLVRNPTGC